jgi:hypothetical protein
VAITTTAQLKAAMPGTYWPLYFNSSAGGKATGAFASCWTGTAASTSWPLATYPGASLAWTVLDRTTTGAFPFNNPTGGQSSYITRARTSTSASPIGTVTIYDRLAQTGAFTPAAATETLTGGPTLTRPDANGADVECWIESITASGATASNYSIRYVDQDGNAPETSPTIAAVTTSTVGMMQRFNLNAGDTGIRSVDRFISTGASGGTAQLVLMRRIAQFPLVANLIVGNQVVVPSAFFDYLGTGMAQIPDNACLAFMLQVSNTASLSFAGSMNIVQA